MELPATQSGKVLILAPHGRIDQVHAEAFQLALDPHLAACRRDGTPVVLDFAGVEYLSSVGLRALMIAAKRVSSQGGRIAVSRLQPLVKEVFEISRFNLVFKVFDTTAAAVESMA